MGYKWYGARNVSDYAGAEGGMWVGIFQTSILLGYFRSIMSRPFSLPMIKEQ